MSVTDSAGREWFEGICTICAQPALHGKLRKDRSQHIIRCKRCGTYIISTVSSEAMHLRPSAERDVLAKLIAEENRRGNIYAVNGSPIPGGGILDEVIE